MKKKAVFCLVLNTLLFCSCLSSKGEFPDSGKVTLPPPPVMTKVPLINYEGIGIKYEIENMLLEQFVVYPDPDASGQYAAKLLDESSRAQVKVFFAEPGTYECLVCEKAFSNDSSAFYVYIENVPYRVYADDPPTGFWDLTKRAPIYFDVVEPRTILVTIQANSEKRYGTTGMDLDYIQFVKRY